VAVGLPGDLPKGTYTVVWRVVSADSHPVKGAFVVHVGVPAAASEGVASRVPSEDAPAGVSDLLTASRIVAFAAILLVAGGAGFLAFGVGTRVSRLGGRLWRLVAVTAAMLVVAALVSVGLQGALAAGRGGGAVVDPDVLSAVLDTRFGRVWLAIAAAALGVAVVAWLTSRSREGAPVALRAPGTALAVALVVAPSFAGHPREAGVAATVSDIAHLGAASAWVGGLAVMALALLWAGAERPSVASWLVPRFSGTALVAVAALLAGGGVSAWIQAGSWNGLVSTTHGKLVIVKVALVVPLLVLGALNRRRVPRIGSGDGLPVARLVRTSSAELALMACVVVVAGILVGEPPGRAVAKTAAGPFAAAAPLGPLELNIVVDPAQQGANAIHIYTLDRSGQPAAVDEVDVSATQADAGIGPLRFIARPAGPDHVVVPRAFLPVAGRWQVRVEARRGRFDLYTTVLFVPIGAQSS
jgi:copper transport protein